MAKKSIAQVLFPDCSDDEIAVGEQALRRILDVIEGRVDARQARTVLAAAASILRELCMEREWRPESLKPKRPASMDCKAKRRRMHLESLGT